MEHTSIKSGLQVGERVVIDGSDRLKEGAKITIPADKPKMASGASGARGLRRHRRHRHRRRRARLTAAIATSNPQRSDA